MIQIKSQKNVENQNIITFPYETSSCDPVTLRQHKLSIPADVASSEKPAGPTNRHRVLCGGLAILLESVHVLEATSRIPQYFSHIPKNHCGSNLSWKDHGEAVEPSRGSDPGTETMKTKTTIFWTNGTSIKQKPPVFMAKINKNSSNFTLMLDGCCIQKKWLASEPTKKAQLQIAH